MRRFKSSFQNFNLKILSLTLYNYYLLLYCNLPKQPTTKYISLLSNKKKFRKIYIWNENYNLNIYDEKKTFSPNPFIQASLHPIK